MPDEPEKSVGAQTEASIVHTIFDLANLLMKGGEQLSATAGLTTQQWIVLLQIAGDPNFPGLEPRPAAEGVLPSEIAAARGVSRATVSGIVSGLLARGLIRAAEDPSDRRRRRLVPTDEGLAVLGGLAPARHAANERLFGPLDAEERDELLRLLQLCLEGFLTRRRERR